MSVIVSCITLDLLCRMGCKKLYYLSFVYAHMKVKYRRFNVPDDQILMRFAYMKIFYFLHKFLKFKSILRSNTWL